MTEDETFLRLKGMTYDQASALYFKLFNTRIERINDYRAYKDELDTHLLPYGWTVDKLALHQRRQ
jgi:hypothetical protein